MRMFDIIKKKRDGFALSCEEIKFFVDGYTKGEIPDYQASALAMAIYFKGMTGEETAYLTECMAKSGDTLDLSELGDRTVDKHSTGGVGDKTTLVISPIVCACGGVIAKMSGRGLGHTGGTVDKLESIPGFRASMSGNEFINQSADVGICVIGQSENLTPCDKKLYALRDVTATIDSVPLIASSVMSKKIAAGSKSIVLDVKCGSGAFLKTPDEAKILAREMVDIGKKCGRNMTALITDMDVPLGNAVGNSLEVCEAVEILKGKGPEDLHEVCLELSANMLSLCLEIEYEKAYSMAKTAIDDGSALEKMKQWIKAQGGDVSVIENTDNFVKAKHKYEIASPKGGYITAMNTEKIGIASMLLGAGRKTKDDSIDYSAGLVISAKVGSAVEKGELLCTLYANDEKLFENAAKEYLSALAFGSEPPVRKPHIYETVK